MRPLEILFIVALVLYSCAIWSHKFIGTLTSRMVLVFGTGLAADVAGTVLLCIVSAESLKMTLHAVSGFASLIIMALHFVWAVLALRSRGKFGEYFNRFSLYAWFLWLVAFISGIPLH